MQTFKRPMFRKGGEVEGGITSGMRSNFQNGTPSDRIKQALTKFSTPAVDPVAQLLIQGGLRGLSETGGGSTLGNLALAFEPAVGQAFKSMQGKQDFLRDIELAGVEADISKEQTDEKNKLTKEIANLEMQFKQSEGDKNRQNKIQVELEKRKTKLAELQFKVDNPEASNLRTDQVRPAFENVVSNLTATYTESKNPAVKAAPDLTAFNITKFRREAKPEVLAKYKGFKPYTFDNKGRILALPIDKYKPGDIIYDPVTTDFLIFDNAGGTYRLDPLTFEIQE
jgi:hypothetical protein|tara:strand:+ start:361 stop:1206 length:846 start_codon:yes stop_codon:yes gene_type:complete